MLDWWWDNIDSTKRYKLWHPDSHLKFTWENRSDGHVDSRTLECSDLIAENALTEGHVNACSASERRVSVSYRVVCAGALVVVHGPLGYDRPV
jgi:hypothetical protein